MSSDGSSLPEEWRTVVGASAYEVSDLGNVRRGSKLLHPGRVSGRLGYLRVSLRFDTGVKGTAYLHHIVAEAFLGPRPANFWALHHDGNVCNCRAVNLYWGTPQDNSNDRVRHGRSGKGRLNPNAKLSDTEVSEIRKLYAEGGYTQTEIGELYGVRQSHVSRIVRSTSWSD